VEARQELGGELGHGGTGEPADGGSGASGSSGGGSLLRNLLRFGRLLRGAGVEGPAGRMLEVVRALGWVGLSRRDDFYHALRSLLVHRQEDLARFDQAFGLFWRPPRRRAGRHEPRALGEQPRALARLEVLLPGLAVDDQERLDPDAETAGRDTETVRTYSPAEIRRDRDFARYSREELAAAEAMLATMKWDLGLRRTRRWTSGRGRTIDLRRVVRRCLQYGGEPLELPRRRRKVRVRPLILVCDVSGSMERYTRMLLHFVHSVARSRDRVEAFLFATRLTRITDHLRGDRIDRAVADIARAVPDWSGGTRIGEALRAFNVGWARRVLSRGPVVLLISDGWDRGDPALLRREIARLQRSCHRLVWLNPLLGSPDYEPLTRGMQAALPFVDDFLPVHSLSSLEALAAHLAALGPRRATRAPYRGAGLQRAKQVNRRGTVTRGVHTAGTQGPQERREAGPQRIL
jgi:uncharacterized protein